VRDELIGANSTEVFRNWELGMALLFLRCRERGLDSDGNAKLRARSLAATPRGISSSF